MSPAAGPLARPPVSGRRRGTSSSPRPPRRPARGAAHRRRPLHGPAAPQGDPAGTGGRRMPLKRDLGSLCRRRRLRSRGPPQGWPQAAGGTVRPCPPCVSRRTVQAKPLCHGRRGSRGRHRGSGARTGGPPTRQGPAPRSTARPRGGCCGGGGRAAPRAPAPPGCSPTRAGPPPAPSARHPCRPRPLASASAPHRACRESEALRRGGRRLQHPDVSVAAVPSWTWPLNSLGPCAFWQRQPRHPSATKHP
mmetsp:Transcript_6614/g.15912  ORF Transcript_6614/g.15912 Transcript_6614/m.15912 type:complete len:249 (-) Transcript_6614:711-1457(-)